jgi:hypothetical protein
MAAGGSTTGRVQRLNRIAVTTACAAIEKTTTAVRRPRLVARGSSTLPNILGEAGGG